MTDLYDQRFFAWVNHTAKRAASELLPIVRDGVRASSVLDVGCGQGAWLSAWQELGVHDCVGIDGSYVRVDALLIPRQQFVGVDLATSWSLGRRFDLVQSLEVAEHLPTTSAEWFVDRICAHGDVVLFSAAQPGQGGENHINERKPSYWAGLFAERGYSAFDFVRPRVRENKEIAPWYRLNIVLYANHIGIARLSSNALAGRVDGLSKLDIAGGLPWTLRCLILRPFPTSVVTGLSRVRARAVLALSRRARKTA
jgi:SAM-dependent methyltransferase